MEFVSSSSGPAENIVFFGAHDGNSDCPAVVNTESKDRMPSVVPDVCHEKVMK